MDWIWKQARGHDEEGGGIHSSGGCLPHYYCCAPPPPHPPLSCWKGWWLICLWMRLHKRVYRPIYITLRSPGGRSGPSSCAICSIKVEKFAKLPFSSADTELRKDFIRKQILFLSFIVVSRRVLRTMCCAAMCSLTLCRWCHQLFSLALRWRCMIFKYLIGSD